MSINPEKIFLLAQQGAPQAQQSPMGLFIPMVLMIIIFYFLLIRPQTKREKKTDASEQCARDAEGAAKCDAAELDAASAR